ncbi:ATP-citrate synthase [Operophtera brumata]|uniref:ATP citrate synthase n=1 Tax=Operophtera brumata TaxID=104452 RepID=A0A0L7LN05_OPEBR|nr:ATP-citrate synthase [Operophtera brumata]
MTAIVGLALGQKPIPAEHRLDYAPHQLPKPQAAGMLDFDYISRRPEPSVVAIVYPFTADHKQKYYFGNKEVFIPVIIAEGIPENMTRKIIKLADARSGMLDFDYISRRPEPSVVAIVYPFTADHKQKYYFGNKEVFIPVFSDMDVAMRKHQEATVLVRVNTDYLNNIVCKNADGVCEGVAIGGDRYPGTTFIDHLLRTRTASAKESRSAEIDTREPPSSTIYSDEVKHRLSKQHRLQERGRRLRRSLDRRRQIPGNHLHQPSTQVRDNTDYLNDIVCKNADGVCEGVSIGGDRYPGTTFIDHLLRFEADPNVKMLVLLGEVGGVEEYHVCRAIRDGLIKKPMFEQAGENN